MNEIKNGFILTTSPQDLDDSNVNTTITGGGNAESAPAPQTETQTRTQTGTQTQTAAVEEPPPASIVGPTILMYVVLFAAMYFILIRPQRKQAKSLKILRENIRPGDNVVTQSGMYGKVTDVGEDCYVIEFGVNRGVKIPVSKSEIAAIKAPKMTPIHIEPKEE